MKWIVRARVGICLLLSSAGTARVKEVGPAMQELGAEPLRGFPLSASALIMSCLMDRSPSL